MLIPSCSGKPPSPCFIISFREKGRSLADTGVLVAVPHPIALCCYGGFSRRQLPGFVWSVLLVCATVPYGSP